MGTPMPERTVEFWCELSEASEKSGDHLGAADSAILGLEQFPQAQELQYRAVLSLSRAGAQRRAMQMWQKFGFAAHLEGGTTSEIIAALGARLWREQAFAADAKDRPAKLKEAAARYEAIYRRTRGSFPGINAAVLFELSDDHGRASEIASQIVEQSNRNISGTNEAAYQLSADRAAAHLLQNDLSAAEAAIIQAAGFGGKASSIASTRKQLLEICKYKGIDVSILSPLKNRSVVHYTGHIISPAGARGRFPADAETQRRGPHKKDASGPRYWLRIWVSGVRRRHNDCRSTA